jgi:hypothetical protein
MGIATAIVGSALIGGAVASRGASKQSRAIEQGAKTASEATLTGQREALAATQPFRDLSLEQLNQLAALYAPGGEYARMPTLEELQFDPGYGLRFEEGQRALERSAAARGGLLSGPMLRGITRFGQEMKSQEYQNAMARAMAQRGARTNVLSTVGGMGPAIAGQQANIFTGTGANLANIAQQQAAGRASAYGAQYNALGQAISQAGMGYGLYKGGYFDRAGGGQG